MSLESKRVIKQQEEAKRLSDEQKMRIFDLEREIKSLKEMKEAKEAKLMEILRAERDLKGSWNWVEKSFGSWSSNLTKSLKKRSRKITKVNFPKNSLLNHYKVESSEKKISQVNQICKSKD